jgi:hypothetical protein
LISFLNFSIVCKFKALIVLSLGVSFDKKLNPNHLPKSLQILKVSSRYKYLDKLKKDLPENIRLEIFP